MEKKKMIVCVDHESVVYRSKQLNFRFAGGKNWTILCLVYVYNTAVCMPELKSNQISYSIFENGDRKTEKIKRSYHKLENTKVQNESGLT